MDKLDKPKRKIIAMVQRKKNGQFACGKSGNPKGRPSTTSTLIRKQLATHSEDIIRVVREAALGGDIQACKMILDRICPPLKPQAESLAVNLASHTSLVDMGAALIRAIAEGNLPPDMGIQLITAVSQFANTVKINEQLPHPENQPIFTRIVMRLVDSKGNVIDKIEKEIPIPPYEK